MDMLAVHLQLSLMTNTTWKWLNWIARLIALGLLCWFSWALTVLCWLKRSVKQQNGKRKCSFQVSLLLLGILLLVKEKKGSIEEATYILILLARVLCCSFLSTSCMLKHLYVFWAPVSPGCTEGIVPAREGLSWFCVQSWAYSCKGISVWHSFKSLWEGGKVTSCCSSSFLMHYLWQYMFCKIWCSECSRSLWVLMYWGESWKK